MTMRIPECRAGDDPAAMYEALDEAGCLVVHDMVQADARAAVRVLPLQLKKIAFLRGRNRRRARRRANDSTVYQQSVSARATLLPQPTPSILRRPARP